MHDHHQKTIVHGFLLLDPSIIDVQVSCSLNLKKQRFAGEFKTSTLHF